jgi:hypothetical protein
MDWREGTSKRSWWWKVRILFEDFTALVSACPPQYSALPMASFLSSSSSSSSSTTTTPRPLTLNIYVPPPSTGVSGFFSNTFTNLGYGTYHTEISIDGVTYWFTPNGIEQRNSVAPMQIESWAFHETVTLGSTTLTKSQINTIVNALRSSSYNANLYHLMYRNCNHFTETLSHSIIHYDTLPDKTFTPPTHGPGSFPQYINRLAKSTAFIKFGDDYINKYANVMHEARLGCDAFNRVSWEIEGVKNVKKVEKKMAEKKVLTNKQKEMIEKLKNDKK